LGGIKNVLDRDRGRAGSDQPISRTKNCLPLELVTSLPLRRDRPLASLRFHFRYISGSNTENSSSWTAPDAVVPYAAEKGFARSGGNKSLKSVPIWSHVDVLVDDDVSSWDASFKEYERTWSYIQRPFLEARGYTDLADHAKLIASDSANAEARVRAG